MENQKVKILNSIYSIIEEDTQCKYDLLDSIIELLNENQVNKIENIISNQFKN